MWEKGNPYALFMGLQNWRATMEKIRGFSELKTELPRIQQFHFWGFT